MADACECGNEPSGSVKCGKYGRDRQATDNNITKRMRFACRITESTDTHAEYVIFLILSFRRVLYVICFLLGNSPASEF